MLVLACNLSRYLDGPNVNDKMQNKTMYIYLIHKQIFKTFISFAIICRQFSVIESRPIYITPFLYQA